MIILIRRLGSGWGGAYGHFMYDTKHKKKVNLDKYFKLTKDPEAFKIDIIGKKVKEFPKECVIPFPPDLSLLNFLPVCDLTNEHYSVFDIQIDEVYVLHKGEVRKVYSSDTGLYPTNPALRAKLRKLIEYG